MTKVVVGRHSLHSHLRHAQKMVAIKELMGYKLSILKFNNF